MHNYSGFETLITQNICQKSLIAPNISAFSIAVKLNFKTKKP